MTLEQELIIRREGFNAAKRCRDNWFAGVNSCPYGPSPPGGGDPRAAAWYAGWWFFFYTIKPWADLLQRLSTM